jgi:uncharacterized protein YggU (UPF0235/DUF167 family)
MPRRLVVKVTPRARVSSLEQAADGTWVARLRAPPVDGKANAELLRLVARELGCAVRDITIRSGASARLKHLEIDD